MVIDPYDRSRRVLPVHFLALNLPIFSTLKTRAIIFSKRNINVGSLQKLTLFGRDIEFSDQITFLGMILDKKLTWGEHIKN